MATYTLVQALSYARHMCGDGVGNLYVIGLDTVGTEVVKVYKYNIATDVLTDISGSTFENFSAGSDGQPAIEWFDGTVYIEISNAGVATDAYVYRWDGGTSWTLVDTASLGGVATLGANLETDGTRLAWCAAHSPIPYTFRASTDGTTWANQVMALGDRVYQIYYDASQQGKLVARVYEDTGPDRRVLVHSGGNNWSALSASDIGNFDLCGTEDTYQFFQTTGLTGLRRSTDWGVNLTAIAGTWYGLIQPFIYNTGYGVFAAGLANNTNRDQVRLWNAGTLTFDLDGTPAAGNQVRSRPCYYSGYLYVLVRDVGICVRDTPIGPVAVVAYSVSQPAQGMDVSADDQYLHVGVLLAGLPILLRLLSDLSADPTVVFNPGAGSAIAVQCGRQHDDLVLVYGNFGADKVEMSDDDGATWSVIDPGGWSGLAFPAILGPDDDDRVLIAIDGDAALRETLDAGVAWEDLNVAMPFAVGGMDRLDIHAQEIVIGSRNGARPDRVYYSPNNAASLEDVTAGAASVETTAILVG